MTGSIVTVTGSPTKKRGFLVLKQRFWAPKPNLSTCHLSPEYTFYTSSYYYNTSPRNPGDRLTGSPKERKNRVNDLNKWVFGVENLSPLGEVTGCDRLTI